MLKLLAIIVVIVLFLRSIGFLIRFLLGGMARRDPREFNSGNPQNKSRTKAPGGDVNIDYVPGKGGKKKKGYKGGDYVDYEEVK